MRNADALTRHDIRHAVCVACGKRGLISKTTNKCVGTTFLGPDKKAKDRIEACMRRVALRDKEKQRKHLQPAPKINVFHDWEKPKKPVRNAAYWKTTKNER